MKNYLQLSLLVIGFACCSSTQSVIRPVTKSANKVADLKYAVDNETPLPEPKKGNAKNIIFMVGDGMGITQITAGLYTNNNQLSLEKFKHIGLHKTHSGKEFVTDSAAGATAFACGVKTYNGAIGVDINAKPVTTILEEAERKGLSTGLVATSSIVHATPASFIAHQPQRKMYEEIAEDFLKTDIDVFIGGGKKFFDRREKDERNLYQELVDKGYVVKDYFSGLLSDFKVKNNQKIAYFTADEEPIPVLQGRTYLEDASMLAIEQLSKNSQDGFFLMIEGSQIDWGGHANNIDYVISEMLEFDRVIGSVLKWAVKDKNTLVVVTADHETGGLSINGGSMDVLEIQFTSTYHTADLIPVFSYGPGAEAFQGIYENTAIYGKMKKAIGL